ncbi:MAG: CapA family protein [Gemmatimonadetes bacterium]|nr:CapA family protein [Gemmatimonadota bacterium]
MGWLRAWVVRIGAALAATAVAGCGGAPEGVVPRAGAPEADAQPETTVRTGAVSIALAGDVMLGRLVNDLIYEAGPAYVWGEMLESLRAYDLFLVNLEFALTSHTEPWHDGAFKAFYFRADPSAVESLQEAGVDFASLANNHALDFQVAGMLETLRVLEGAGIAHAGAGENAAAARVPAVLRAKGLRVGVVSWADYPVEWAAGEDSPGINFTPVSVEAEDFAAVERAIRAAREQADFVVFSIHWGPNWRVRPPEGFRRFARAVIDAGVDVFWGHSAHIVQGVEFYSGRPILYDTGDFVDDYAVDPEKRNDLSALCGEMGTEVVEGEAGVLLRPAGR